MIQRVVLVPVYVLASSVSEGKNKNAVIMFASFTSQESCGDSLSNIPMAVEDWKHYASKNFIPLT